MPLLVLLMLPAAAGAVVLLRYPVRSTGTDFVVVVSASDAEHASRVMGRFDIACNHFGLLFSSVRLVLLGRGGNRVSVSSVFRRSQPPVLSTRFKRKGRKKGGSPSLSASVWWDLRRNWAVGFSGYRGPFGQVLWWVA